jgi:hypothetical protein
MRTSWLLLLLAAGSACDNSAKATDGRSSGPAVLPSHQYESCAATVDCESGLRCVDAVCRSAEAVVVGDYHAAVGMRALLAGDLEDAVKSYAEASNQYKAAGKEAPTWLDCAQGHALVAARKNQDYAELAARVLHRCVSAAPVGSALRGRGLADLAELSDLGLDPLILATPPPADLYLTKGAVTKAPAADAVKVTVAGDGKASGKAWDTLVASLTGARAQLLPCWTQFGQQTGSVAIAIRFRNRFIQSEIDEDLDRWKLSAEPAPGADPAASKCAVDAMAGLVKDFRGSGGFDSVATVTLGP